MADIPTNTSYSGGGKEINPAQAYAAARKAILARFGASGQPEPQKQGWQGQGTSKVNWGPGQQPVAGIPYAMPTVNPEQPQYAAPQTYKNLGTGEQTTSYVPPDYKTAPGLTGKYATPSDVKNLRFRNVPESLGAGQYVTDVAQPGQVIRSQRAVRPDQYQGSSVEYPSETVGELSTQILGGQKSASDKSFGMGFHIDHIVPLWLGGADTPENKQLLDPYTHEKKTKVQAVALTLLQAKKITPDQAKMMAIRWKEHDDSGIKPLNNGFADLANAEEVSKRWQLEESQVKPVKWGDVWNELKNLKNFGQEKLGTSAPAGFLREFVKSGASSVTFGYIPYEMDDDYKDGTAKAAAMAGSVAGQIVGILGPIKGIGLMFGGMTKGLRKIGMLSKLAEGGVVGTDMVSKIGFAKNAGEGAKILTDMAPKLESTKKWLEAGKQAGLFTTYGQLSKEGLLGQSITGEQNHWGERFIWDAVSGGAMGKWSNPSRAAKDALKVASLSTTLDAMFRSDDPDWTIESSLSNGLTMGGIHYLALKSGGGVTTNRLRQDITGGKIDPAIKSGLFSAAKFNPELKAELQKTTGLNTEALEAQIAKAQQEMAQKVVAVTKKGEDVDFDTITKQYILNLWNARQTYIKGLPEAEQHAARLEDLSSLIRHVYKNEPVKDRLTYALHQAGDKLEPTLPKSPSLASGENPPPQGVTRIPMAGTEADKRVKMNIAIADQANKEARLGGEGLIVRRPEQGALINAATGGRYTAPENHLEVYVPVYTDKSKTTIQDWLHIGYVPETGKVERFNTENPKLTRFDPATANKDVIGGQMAESGEMVRKFDLEWASPETPKGTAAAVIQLRADSSERSKILNEVWNTRSKERSVNESTSKLDEQKMSNAGMNVEWMNAVVADFKSAMETQDPEKMATMINKNWGKGTITTEGARAILDNPTFTIGDMFKSVRNSPNWKRAAYILDDQMRPSKEAAAAFKEYTNTNLKTHQVPAEVKAEIPKNVAANVSKAVPEAAVPEITIESPRQAVTLGGEDFGGGKPPAKKFKSLPAVVKKQATVEPAPEIKAAVEAVKESPVIEAIKETPKEVVQPSPVVPVAKKQTSIEIGAPKSSKTQSPGTTRELDRADIKRMMNEESPFDKKDTESLFDKAFNPKPTAERDSFESPSEASAVKILRAAGEENVLQSPDGTIFIDPKSKLTGTIIRERSGLSALEFMDGIDYMSSTVSEIKSRGKEVGRVLGDITFRGAKRPDARIADTGKGKRVVYDEKDWKTGVVKEKTSYPGSGTTDWIAKRAVDAARAIKDKKPLSYEDGLATGFIKALEKITGKSVPPGSLHKQFGIDGFFAKLSEKAKAKTDEMGREITQPRGLLKSRVEQERGRIGEIPQETREKLFRKRIREEAESRDERKKTDEDLSSELPVDRTPFDEGPQMGKSVDVDQGETFGLRMEDRAQSMKENIPISELEYSLPGMALRTAGEKVTATDGIKDGLLLARQFRDHFGLISKQKPKFIDFMELEKEIRGSYDPEFKKILPLMKKSELRRVSKAIMQKTAPEGTVVEVPGNPPFEKPASPLVDVKEMIKKHDGADPAGSTKIMETILKKQGYKKKNTGRTYENIWENKKYLNVLKASKEVKLANPNK